MQRLGKLSNKYQKRTIRAIYAQTQGTPVSAVLDTSLRNADGSFRKPLAADTLPVARSADAFTLKNGLVPGTVMLKGQGDYMVVATGANSAALKPFGLLANFIGGDLDDIGDENQIGVWRGHDSRWELLAPAYDDTGLAAAYAAATAGNPVPLYAGVDGRLVYNASPANRVQVANLVERVNVSRIVIDLIV